MLKSCHNNSRKRIIKNKKLYFYATGLAIYLSGISNENQIETFYMHSVLFENFIVSELLKNGFFEGKSDELYFRRDNNGVEIDVIEEDGRELHAH